MEKKYEKILTLKIFQKVKYFIIYDSIKECFYDIFNKKKLKILLLKKKKIH